jgi:hypothetical protein
MAFGLGFKVAFDIGFKVAFDLGSKLSSPGALRATGLAWDLIDIRIESQSEFKYKDDCNKIHARVATQNTFVNPTLHP